MLTEGLFWLYGVLFFSSAGLMRLLLDLLRKKKRLRGLLYITCALACLAVFWSLPGRTAFPPARDGWIFSLSAVLPGLLTGVHILLLALPPAGFLALSVILEKPLKPFVPREGKPLATLSFYPTVEERLFFEWTPTGEAPVFGQLTGEKIAPVVRREILPGYFFLIEPSWDVIALTTRNLAAAQLPEQNNDLFYALPAEPEDTASLVRYEYPALRFLDPGYFRSYTIQIRKNGELEIIGTKLSR